MGEMDFEQWFNTVFPDHEDGCLYGKLALKNCWETCEAITKRKIEQLKIEIEQLKLEKKLTAEQEARDIRTRFAC